MIIGFMKIEEWIGNQIYSDDSIHSLYTDQMEEKYGILFMVLRLNQCLQKSME